MGKSSNKMFVHFTSDDCRFGVRQKRVGSFSELIFSQRNTAGRNTLGDALRCTSIKRAELDCRSYLGFANGKRVFIYQLRAQQKTKLLHIS